MKPIEVGDFVTEFKQLLFISSQNRVSGSSHDFLVDMPPISNNCLKQVQLVDVSIPLTFYTINEHNDTLEFTRGTGYTATLTRGFYDATTLCTHLSSAMNTAIANSFSATFDTVTNKITITGSSSFSIEFSTNTITKRLGRLLGFGEANTATGTTLTGSNVVDFYQTKLIAISMSGLGARIPTITTGSSIFTTFLVDCTVPLRAIQKLSSYPKLPVASKWDRQCRIQLWDVSNGTALNINGAEWEMQIEVLFERS